MNKPDVMPAGATVVRWQPMDPPGPTSTGERFDWRETWGPGQWEDEPDLVEWRTPGSTMPRLALRNNFGSWCGYVGLPPGHPSHGKGYDAPAIEGLSVHGGVTYANECGGKICHAPLPGEPAHVWWIGFDTAHSGDLSPGLRATTRRLCGSRQREWETYKNLAYVVSETEQLAAQLEGGGGQ